MRSNQWIRSRWILLGCAIWIHHSTTARAQQGRVLLTRAECVEDVATAFEIMESVHPNLHSVLSKDELARRRQRLEQSFPARITTTEFFCQFAPLIAELRDGHTSLPLPTAAFLGEESRQLIPLEIEIRNDGVVVSADYSQAPPSLVGTQLTHINGKRVEDLIKIMMSHQHQELLGSRRRRIDEFFRAYLWLLCDVDGPFAVKYRTADTDTGKSKTLEGKTLASISAIRRRQANGNRPLYAYRFDQASKIGVFEYNACANNDRFREFLRETFMQVKREQPVAIIVDARNNGGGSARANVALFDYLTDQPYRMYSRCEVRVSRFIKEKLGREAFEQRYFPWLTPDGSIQSYTFPMRESDENPLRFGGPLIVLSGPSTLSSGMNFVNAVKDCGLGVVVGEETGNPATAFGDLEAFRLPNSQLEIYVSTKYFVRPNGQTDRRGVMPDYEIHQTDSDTQDGRDAVMDFAKQLAHQLRS